MDSKSVTFTVMGALIETLRPGGDLQELWVRALLDLMCLLVIEESQREKLGQVGLLLKNSTYFHYDTVSPLSWGCFWGGEDLK